MNDLNAAGVITCNGGTFERVKIEGVVTINSDITCKDMNIEGVCRVRGGIACGTGKIAGTTTIYGPVKAENISLQGMLKISGDFSCDSLKVDGTLDVEGVLSADDIDIFMASGCSAREVCGHSLKLRRRGSSVFMSIFKGRRNEFKADSVECDIVDIEHAKVNTILADRVVLGEGCEIGRVEYISSADISPKARVGQLVKRGEEA